MGGASLAIAELTSAIYRKCAQGLIATQALRLTLAEFAEDLLSDFRIIDLEPHRIHLAQELILRHGLRALEAVQRSTLLVLRPLTPVLLSSGLPLLAAARAEGIAAPDPAEVD